MKITQGTFPWTQKTACYVKSVPIDSLRPVTYGDDHAVRAKHSIGVEMGLDLFVGVAGNLPTESVPGLMVEEENRSAPVVVGVTTELEQVLYDVGRDASLLKPCLSMMCDR